MSLLTIYFTAICAFSQCVCLWIKHAKIFVVVASVFLLAILVLLYRKNGCAYVVRRQTSCDHTQSFFSSSSSRLMEVDIDACVTMPISLLYVFIFFSQILSEFSFIQVVIVIALRTHAKKRNKLKQNAHPIHIKHTLPLDLFIKFFRFSQSNRTHYTRSSLAQLSQYEIAYTTRQKKYQNILFSNSIRLNPLFFLSLFFHSARLSFTFHRHKIEIFAFIFSVI